MNLLDAIKSITDRRAPVPPIPHVTADDAQPDDLLVARLECRHTEPNPDGADTPCGWAGNAVVAVWHDTKEALWSCTSGHENSERYGDYS